MSTNLKLDLAIKFNSENFRTRMILSNQLK